MCNETYATILYITGSTVLIVASSLVAGPLYTYGIYHDSDAYRSCNIGNALAFASYVTLGGLIMCISGHCYMYYANMNKLYKTRYFTLVDAVLTLCCLAMGAGYSGALYPENNTHIKCLLGNVASWVMIIIFVLVATLRSYYKAKPLLNPDEESPRYASV